MFNIRCRFPVKFVEVEITFKTQGGSIQLLLRNKGPSGLYWT